MIGEDFDRITAGLDLDAVQHLSKKWSDIKVLLEDSDRISIIAKDVVDHYNEKKKIVRRKAMLAASTKLAAAKYANCISNIPNAPKCTCIISGPTQPISHPLETTTEKQLKDDIINEHYKDKKTINRLIRQFKDEKNELGLLIVCDMFLTGFDAPVVHTMYIDKPLRDHNLIQAISRVNRVWKDKPGGLIVDYIGITDDLKRAFLAFNDSDVKGAMVPTEEIVLYMQQKYDELISTFVCDISKFEYLSP